MPTANLTSSPILNAILSAALVGLMGWNLMTTHQLSTQLGVANATISFALQDRYTATEAKADTLVMSSRVSQLEESTDLLWKRLRELETNEK